MGWFKNLLEAPVLKINWEKDDDKKKDDYVCKECSYGWTSRKKFGTPAFCPRCRSKNIIKVDRG